ncbi:MAG TPA: hypothetical protein VHT51_13545 [Micropepsaceae bacterium]|nr:hypothetical protein [Micropepsaceae bacterium]
MSKLSYLSAAAGLLCFGAALAADRTADDAPPPNFNPDGFTAWAADRPASDDFLPHDKSAGPGPVESDPAHPYVPNGDGIQSTYRVADLTNPILKPWVVAQMKKTNDDVLAGKVPFIARERCWPGGVPAYDIYNRGQPVHILQTKNEVVMINELFASTRHIYLNVPHSKNPKPSWYGESVGHYEGDTLVVDTIGQTDRTFVDNYRTPHTKDLHVVERFRMINDGKSLEVNIRVEDPGAFNMPWTARSTWRRVHPGMLIEDLCEPNNDFYFGYEVAPLPVDNHPAF